MFVDASERSINFKVHVTGAGADAQLFLDALARYIGVEGLDPDSPGNQILMLPVAFEGIPGWKTELHAYAVSAPSSVGARLLSLKLSDAAILVFGPTPASDATLIDEHRSHLEGLGYPWRSFARVGFVPAGREVKPDLDALGTISGDLVRGVGIQDVLRLLASRFIDEAVRQVGKGSR